MLRAAKIHALIVEAERMGLRPRASSALRALPAGLFDDPTNLVEFDQARTALDALAAMLPSDFALRFGGRWTFHEFGIVGYGLLTRRTFGEFADQWVNYIEFIGHPLTFRSVVDDAGWSLEMRPREPLSAPALRLCAEEACASVFPIFRELTGRSLTSPRIDFTDHNPERDAICEALLKVVVRPKASINRLLMRTKDRVASINIADAVLRAFCQRHCGSIMKVGAEAGDIIIDVRDRLLLSRGRPPAIGDIATQLGISKRSLNRHLAAHGWTYARLVDLYHHDYAMALIRTRELCVKEIAYMVGFDSPGSLRRTFRNWTGQSIGAWSCEKLGGPLKRR